MSVLVRDTIAPASQLTAVPRCIADDGQLRLFRARDFLPAFTDACDADLRLELVSVTGSSGSVAPQPDIVRGASQFCLRGQRETATTSRTYSATIRAWDDAGNSRSATFPIVVPSSTCSQGFFSYATNPSVAASSAECTR